MSVPETKCFKYEYIEIPRRQTIFLRHAHISFTTVAAAVMKFCISVAVFALYVYD